MCGSSVDHRSKSKNSRSSAAVDTHARRLCETKFHTGAATHLAGLCAAIAIRSIYAPLVPCGRNTKPTQRTAKYREISEKSVSFPKCPANSTRPPCNTFRLRHRSGRQRPAHITPPRRVNSYRRSSQLSTDGRPSCPTNHPWRSQPSLPRTVRSSPSGERSFERASSTPTGLN